MQISGKYRCIAILGGVFLVLTALGLIAANLVDYLRFHSAIRRIERITDTQFAAMIDEAAQVSKYDDQVTPALARLSPVNVSRSPTLTDVTLYELAPVNDKELGGLPTLPEQIHLTLRIDPSSNNPNVAYFTNSDGKQFSKTVWVKDRELARSLSPDNRILTIALWTRDGYRWIVLKDRILVILSVNGDDFIEATIPLTSTGLAEIRAAIHSLPRAALGKSYSVDAVSDGATLDITFSASGEEGVNDVTMINAWNEDFRHLLTVVSKYSPKKSPLTFADYQTSTEAARPKEITIRTRAEYDAYFWGEPPAPWWCLWRSFRN